MSAQVTIVYNVDGTSGRKCVCKVGTKTWLGHWERGTGLAVPDKCSAKGCGKVVEVGAHVKISGDDQRTTWIVPFCQKHNKRPSSQPIALKWAVTLCGAAAVDCA
jgi:hypothetical protein